MVCCCKLKIIRYSRNLKSDHLKSGLFEDWISNGLVFKWLGFSPNHSKDHSKTGPFKIQSLFITQMILYKMATINPDSRWLGFRISDPI